jgi:hypothetical protein
MFPAKYVKSKHVHGIGAYATLTELQEKELNIEYTHHNKMAAFRQTTLTLDSLEYKETTKQTGHRKTRGNNYRQ